SDNRRRIQNDGNYPRRRRRNAVRSRILVTLFRNRPRANGSGSRRRIHSDSREEDLVDEGPPASSGAGFKTGSALVDRRRRRRRRGARDSGGQQTTGNSAGLRGEGAGIW